MASTETGEHSASQVAAISSLSTDPIVYSYLTQFLPFFRTPHASILAFTKIVIDITSMCWANLFSSWI